VTSTHSQLEEGGIVVTVWRGASGFGTVSSLAQGTSSSAQVTYTVSALDSAIDGGIAEFNNNASARTYRTTNLGAATEDQEFNSATYATTMKFHNAATTATGAQTVGLSAPSYTGIWLCACIEILGSAAAGSSIEPRIDFEPTRIGPF
jgi:hypothetical protein